MGDRPGCWLWLHNLDSDGYGRIFLDGKMQKIHRVVWTIYHGPIPDGMVPDHRCHNEAAAAGRCPGGGACPHRACANPTDLTLETVAGNALSGLSITGLNQRKTKCNAGHDLSGDNLVIRSDGARGCRLCRRNDTRRYRLRG